MDPAVKNLTCSTVHEVNKEWEEDLRKLIEGYPFEKKYREVTGNGDYGTMIDKLSHTNKAYCATFSSTITGWLILQERTDINLPLFQVKWERIQRNRDDIRASLYRKVKEDHPGSCLIIHQPAQNRTANHFFRQQKGNIELDQTFYLYDKKTGTGKWVGSRYGDEITKLQESGYTILTKQMNFAWKI